MNIKRWLAALLIIVIVIASLGLIKFNQIQAAIAFGESFPEPSAAVKSEYAKRIEHSEQYHVIGQLQAKRIINLSNEFAGVITAVNFEPGSLVKQGQVLIQQDVRIEKANLAAANARLALAKSTQKRLAKLLQQKRVSQDEVDNANADVLVASAEVENLSAVIDKKTITAPFSGQVGLNQFQVGQLLNANTPLTSLVGLDKAIWVDFKLPQTLPQLRQGEHVYVKLVKSNAHDSEPLKAKIIAINPAIDANSRQLSYRAELANPNLQLHHNQMVSVIVPMPSISTVAIPTNAIARNHLGSFVFQLQQDENQQWRAKSTQVELGQRVGDLQIIKSGLNGGEFIATEGAFKLKEKLLVFTELPAQQGAQ